jgi:tRNA(fMet)-specific endonuclease VapC
MNGNNIALDTNVAVQVLSDVAATVAFLRAYSQLYLPVPVIGELRFGAMNSARPTENLGRVARLVARCRPINDDVTTADNYATVRLELKKRGTPIPENDIWIAAVCVQHGLPIATLDKHFSNIPDLQVRRP